MLLQLVLGSLVLLVSVVLMAPSAWALEAVFARTHAWLMREPHLPKLVLTVAGVCAWALGMLTVNVWLWALSLRLFGVLPTLEEAVYFALVSFTTLGYGDLVLPQEWRIFGTMAAVNGLLNFGLLTALLVEALRHVRTGQMSHKRAH
ncbi:potassium channel family protein [Rhodobacter sp. NSM]|uniref:potassium channel family protein n=1 Tax=Rhodobacter sp. NSM TaxID=3457501 RepID=UPI003FD61722